MVAVRGTVRGTVRDMARGTVRGTVRDMARGSETINRHRTRYQHRYPLISELVQELSPPPAFITPLPHYPLTH